MSHQKSSNQFYNEFYLHTDWRHPGLQKGINRIQLYFKISALFLHNFPSPGCRILDVGCGTGFYTHCMNACGCHADGIDYSEVAIYQASLNWGKDCQFYIADAQDLTAFAGQYDVIFARGLSLYNTRDPAAAIRLTNHYLSLVRPGGFVLVILASDLSGKDTGWVNLTYSELRSLFAGTQGQMAGPIFFDYWITQAILSFRISPLSRFFLKTISSRSIAGLLGRLLRARGARLPCIFLFTK